jgi:hypothetical protein
LIALQDRLDGRHDPLQRLQLIGRGRVGVQQIEEQGSDLPQLGQPLGLPSGQARADHLRHVGGHHIAKFLHGARPRPGRLGGVGGSQLYVPAGQELTCAGVADQLPGLRGQDRLTRRSALLRTAHLEQRCARQQQLPAPTDPADVERQHLAGPNPKPQRQPDPVAGLVFVQGRPHGKGGVASPPRRCLQAFVDGRPGGQQSITVEGDHLTRVRGDHGHQLPEVGVEQTRQLLAGRAALRQPVGQRREPGDVSEQDGRGEALYPRNIEWFLPRQETGYEELRDVGPETLQRQSHRRTR